MTVEWLYMPRSLIRLEGSREDIDWVLRQTQVGEDAEDVVERAQRELNVTVERQP